MYSWCFILLTDEHFLYYSLKLLYVQGNIKPYLIFVYTKFAFSVDEEASEKRKNECLQEMSILEKKFVEIKDRYSIV